MTTKVVYIWLMCGAISAGLLGDTAIIDFAYDIYMRFTDAVDTIRNTEFYP